MKMTALQNFFQLFNDLLQDQLICWCKRAHLQNIKKHIMVQAHILLSNCNDNIHEISPQDNVWLLTATHYCQNN